MTPDWTHYGLAVAEIMLPLLLALLAWASAQAASWLKTKTRAAQYSHAIDVGSEAVSAVIGAGSAAFLRELRHAAEDGEVTSGEMRAAALAAVKAARRELGKSGEKTLRAAGIEDLDTWLWTRIAGEANASAIDID